MFKKYSNMRWITGALLAVALTGCGTAQGATPAQAGSGSTTVSGDNHLTVDANDIAVDQLNEQQRLAEQGANATGYIVRDPENPAFGRNSIGSSTTTSSSPLVRDPENPAYTGPIRAAPTLVP